MLLRMYSAICLVASVVLSLSLPSDIPPPGTTNQKRAAQDMLQPIMRVPFRAPSFAAGAKLLASGACPLGSISFDKDTKKCASFCVVDRAMVWGREVPYLQKKMCTDRNKNCDIDSRSRTLFIGPSLQDQLAYLGFSSSESIDQRYFRGSFNDDVMVAKPENDLSTPLRPGKHQAVRRVFIPVYRQLCGIITESIDPVEHSEDCNDSLPQRTIGNVCLVDPDTNWKSPHTALGVSRGILINSESGASENCDIQPIEFCKPGVRFDDKELSAPFNQVPQGLQHFLKEKQTTYWDGKGSKDPDCKGDVKAPYDDCVQAVYQIYYSIYDGTLVPKSDRWAACGNKKTSNCAIIAEGPKCQIVLTFYDADADAWAPNSHYKQRAKSRSAANVAPDWTDTWADCAKRGHANALHILGAVAKILSVCGSDGSEVSGTMPIDNTNSGCNTDIRLQAKP